MSPSGTKRIDTMETCAKHPNSEMILCGDIQGLDMRVFSTRVCRECLISSGPFHGVPRVESSAEEYSGAPTPEDIRRESDPDGLDAHEPGAKLDSGKIQAGLLGLFSRALLAVAEVGTFGATKYARGGWQSVENGIERYDDAKVRHMLKGYYEDDDPDSGLSHAAHEAWNALAKLELMLRKTEEVQSDQHT